MGLSHDSILLELLQFLTDAFALSLVVVPKKLVVQGLFGLIQIAIQLLHKLRKNPKLEVLSPLLMDSVLLRICESDPAIFFHLRSRKSFNQSLQFAKLMESGTVLRRLGIGIKVLFKNP